MENLTVDCDDENKNKKQFIPMSLRFHPWMFHSTDLCQDGGKEMLNKQSPLPIIRSTSWRLLSDVTYHDDPYAYFHASPADCGNNYCNIHSLFLLFNLHFVLWVADWRFVRWLHLNIRSAWFQSREAGSGHHLGFVCFEVCAPATQQATVESSASAVGFDLVKPYVA